MRWKKSARLLGLALVVCLAACSAEVELPAARSNVVWPGGRHFEKVIIFVLENRAYEEVMELPYMRQIASEGVLYEHFHAAAHPSYPNYIAMVAGDTFGIESDDQETLKATTLFERLEEEGYDWKIYAEGYPGDCFLGDHAGKYVRKHVPALSFAAIQSDPGRCANVVDETAFAEDMTAGTLPTFSFYIPDQNNNGHDTNMTYAARHLRDVIEPLLASPAVDEGTLVVVTFDEAAGEGYEENQIYTVLLGAMVKAGKVDRAEANHYNLLRTIEDNFGLQRLGRHDEENGPLTGWWVER